MGIGMGMGKGIDVVAQGQEQELMKDIHILSIAGGWV